MNDEEFCALLTKSQQGDQEAAAKIFREIGPAIRCRARLLLSQPDAAVNGASDICQSVLKSFFLGAVGGAFVLSSTGQLYGLLNRMIENKIYNNHRPTLKGPPRSQRNGMDLDQTQAPADADPAYVTEVGELVQRARALFSAAELEIINRRIDGEQWADIGASLGRSADAVRKQIERARKRVAEQLGLENYYDEECE